ncbi:MAG: cation transporter [Cyanobacteria bacterium J083]|nr:MAG: cation transporter [Cyanobacteria bacterium J083]
MTHPQHRHNHTPNYNQAFIIGTSLNVSFVIIEAVFGFLTQSLALLADAGHNLSDVLGLLLAWGASWLVQRPPSKRFTYGLRRSSILTALLNAIIFLLVMGGIAWEAIERLSSPNQVPGTTIILVAAIGVAINTVTALMFISGRQRDLNIKGVFLHMAADALVSLGVVLAGVAILTTGWLWFDPAISLIIVVIVVFSTWQLLQDALYLALDAVPQGIEPEAVATYLREIPGVSEIHDLHIWAMSTTETALTVHLVMPGGHPGDEFLAQTTRQLQQTFGIPHATIQIETGNSLYPCSLAPKKQV